MIYHPGTDRFYAFEPRLDAATNMPRYFELSESADAPQAKRPRLE